MTDTANDWYGPQTATFGDRLAAARETNGLTQEQLGKRLGLKVTTVQKWEQDILEPRANRLSMLAGLLNVSMGWLITGEGEGISAPEDDPISPDLNALMLEIRSVKMQMRGSVDKLARLEKQLRTIMTAQGDNAAVQPADAQDDAETSA